MTSFLRNFQLRNAFALAKDNTVLKSFALHGLVAGLIAIFFLRVEKPISPPPIQITVIETKANASASTQTPSTQRKAPVHSGTRGTLAKKPDTKTIPPALDLRPSYMKGQTLYAMSQNDLKAETEAAVGDEARAKANAKNNYAGDELLHTPPRVVTAFNHLAAQLNRHLDYPSILFEQGVQGTASLELVFDREGKIDEARSLFDGTHRSIRGLLVKAARDALQEWYQSDVYRLKREEFKNQHFHADFAVSYAVENQTSYESSGPNAYEMTRHRSKNQCLNHGTVDVVCVAMKAAGAAENILSDSERIRFDLLKDKLDSYDELELRGINKLLAGT